MAHELSDAELVAQLQNGDIEALGSLYERHRALAYHTALTITRDPQAAEDVVQDCFLRIHRYATSFDTSRPVEPWLYWVAVHRACDWQSDNRRWPQPLGSLIDTLPAPAAQSPESQAERRDLRRQVHEALGSLGALQRDAMTLYYLHSLSLHEIADKLDCPVGTIKSRLHYGRENLCQVLASKPRGERDHVV